MKHTMFPNAADRYHCRVSVGAFVLLACLVGACSGDAPGPNEPMTPEPAAVIAVSGDDQVGIGLEPLARQITVRVENAAGEPLGNITVQFQATGGGSTTPPSVNTDATGQASVTWNLGAPGAAQILTASVLNVAPVQFKATATVAWVVGASGGGLSGAIATSMDAITWTVQETPILRVFQVAFNGRQWVAGGTGLATSPDGITWTARQGPPSVNGVAWDGTQWVVSSSSFLWTSPDGIAWTKRTPATSVGTLGGVATDGSRWIVAGSDCLTSTDGVAWAPLSSLNGKSCEGGIAWNGSLWVVNTARDTVLTSPDAMTWTARPTPVGLLGNPAWSGSAWVVPTGGPSIVLSTDAITYTEWTSDPGTASVSAAWGDTLWVLASSLGPIETSKNGVLWTKRSVAPYNGTLLTDGWCVAYARPLPPGA